jgi:hypothetical protein
MTEWKVYKIRNKVPSSEYIKFELDNYVRYSSGSEKYIYCKNIYPFNDYQVDDQIEIDNDETRQRDSTHDFTSTSEVRRTTLSALIPASSSHSLTSRQTWLDTSAIRQEAYQVDNSSSRGGFRENSAHIDRDTGLEFYESIEYTKNHIHYKSTKRW